MFRRHVSISSVQIYPSARRHVTNVVLKVVRISGLTDSLEVRRRVRVEPRGCCGPQLQSSARSRERAFVLNRRYNAVCLVWEVLLFAHCLLEAWFLARWIPSPAFSFKCSAGCQLPGCFPLADRSLGIRVYKPYFSWVSRRLSSSFQRRRAVAINLCYVAQYRQANATTFVYSCIKCFSCRCCSPLLYMYTTYIPYLLLGAEPFLRSWSVLSFSRNSPNCMEPEGSLPHLQVTAICPYSEPDQSNPCPPHPTSWRSILILYFHLRLGLPSGLKPSGLPTKTLYTPLLSPHVLHAPPISLFSILSPEQYLLRSKNNSTLQNVLIIKAQLLF